MKRILTTLGVVTGAALVQAEEWTFDDLVGWSGDTANASIVPAPVGMVGNALLMQGSAADQMTWMTWGTTLGSFANPQVSFQFQVADTEPADPTELYVRLGGMNDYVAILESDEASDTFNIQVTASGIDGAPVAASIAFGTVHSLQLVYQPGDQVAVSLDGNLLTTLTGLPWHSDFSFGDLSIRSQRAFSHMDNLVIQNVPEPSLAALVSGLVVLSLLVRRRLS